MGHFSVEIYTPPGSTLSANQHMMGMNVFLGLRFGIWGEERKVSDVAEEAERFLRYGLGVRD